MPPGIGERGQRKYLLESDISSGPFVAADAGPATRASWTPADIAAAPLLQQSTRPEAWRQWFAAMDVDSPMALAGPRYDLFSMAAVAATAGLGIALVPKMLVMAELARGELVIACDRPLHGASHYYLVIPETAAGNARLRHFSEWLQQAAAANHAVDQAPPVSGTRGTSPFPASGPSRKQRLRGLTGPQSSFNEK